MEITASSSWNSRDDNGAAWSLIAVQLAAVVIERPRAFLRLYARPDSSIKSASIIHKDFFIIRILNAPLKK